MDEGKQDNDRLVESNVRQPAVEFIVVNCQRKRHKHHHHQRTNGSTILFTFTFPVNLDLFNLSTVRLRESW